MKELRGPPASSASTDTDRGALLLEVVLSLGIFVGGISAIAPSRRADLAGIGIYALLAATLATLMTGALAGFYYNGESGILGL